MKKRYCTYSTHFIVSVKVDDKVKMIKFNERDAEKKLSCFSTDNAKEQEALENSSSFGAHYWVDETFIQVQPEPEEGKPLTEMEFDTANEARDFLTSEPYNVVKNTIYQPKALLKKAAELGFEFKIKSNNQ